MGMKRKGMLFIALTLSVSLLLGACGNNEVNNVGVNTEEPVSEEVVEEPVSEEVGEETVEAVTDYIAAPYTVDAELQGPTEYLEPVFYENTDGPTIGVTLVGVISENGVYFKDSNNNGELDIFEDWRLDTQTRAEDLLAQMNLKQRIGLLENQLSCSPVSTSVDAVYDENEKVLLDKLMVVTEDALNMPADIVNEEGRSTRGNSTGEIITFESRSGVLRSPSDVETTALWTNAVNMTAEYAAVAKSEPMIPFTIISNPINIAGIPGSLGIAAAAMGDGNYDLVEQYADMDRQIWDAKGISRMYGPQIDLVTDPRWPRNNTTYTEVPEVMAGIAVALTEGYQTGTDGVQDGDVALMMKHFPGDGAAYNGFESHNLLGQWRVYSTENSLENYQLVAFQAAIDAGLAGIMPGYSRQAVDGTFGNVAQTYHGVEIPSDAIANAYSPIILQTLLRDTMGFDGFVNTDSGILGDRNFGAEELTDAERVAKAINGGSDVIGESFGIISWDKYQEAFDQGLIDEAAFNRATLNMLKPIISMGQLDNPYKDVEESKATFDRLSEDMNNVAAQLNQKSVVLMKNHDAVLPLNDTTKTIYVQTFKAESNASFGGYGGAAVDYTEEYINAFEAAGFTIVDSPEDADIAFFGVMPGGIAQSNPYMNVLDLVEKVDVPEVNFPMDTTETGDMYELTTLEDVDDIAEIADVVHANGGIVIASIKISSPWILTNLEPYCDGLIGTFDSSTSAQLDVLTGAYNPTGKLPITMVSCEEVIAVVDTEIDGVTYQICVSPNDVPGYDKDQYISEEVLAQSPSGSYAYQDVDGNIYTAWFGLSY